MVPERTDDGVVLLVGFDDSVTDDAVTDGAGDDEPVETTDSRGVGAALEASLPYTVHRVDRVDAALSRAETAECVVTAASLPDASGLELVRTIDDRFPETPVVLAPKDGDERLASEAIRAGVADYVPRPVSPDRLTASVEHAIADARRRRRDRDRALEFDAIFDDPHTYTWVLEPDGSLVRANDAAQDALVSHRDAGSLVRDHENDGSHGRDHGRTESNDIEATDRVDLRGRPFWECPWWTEGATDEVRDAIDRAASGVVDHRELEAAGVGPRAPTGDETGGSDGTAASDASDDARTPRRMLEVNVRPVTDETGEVVSLVAEATDVTERVRLETELRESEELHRVTLNNMTDTVLITDESGAFTYVCPNVHFIFGHSDETIYGMETIDELLGEDLFDRDELAEKGVLTNIECTATDRAGHEHTLLVNVREVSIQGGTILYSCRDVTKRKQREEALAALQRTARQLLYAETIGEIGRIVVEDATDVLNVEASAAFVFDRDENVLRPVATSSEMERLHGPFQSFRANDDSITGHTFVDGETRFFDDVHESERLTNRATDVRSAAFVPLGDHGVFVAGSAEVGRFDEVTRELTDLLAATAEAALDRVERESTLREQDRELQRQNRQLTRLNRINEIIREIDQALVRAETREEIERAVCEQLTADDRFRFAWIGEPDPAGETLTARAWDGRGREYLDSVSFPLERAADGTEREPASETARTGSITVVSNVVDHLREAPWRKEALAREYQSVVSVPLAYDEFTYGVLTVYADRPSAFDDVSRAVFEELGETIASAMGAVERKNALLTASGTRLEVDIRDEGFVFHRLAKRANCTVSFSGGVRQTDDGTSVFASIDGAAVGDVAAIASELVSIEGVQVITEGDEAERNGSDGAAPGGTLQLHLSQQFLALRLADHGIVLRHVEATPEAARVVIDVPSSVDARRSVEVVENAFTDVTLVSKETVERRSVRDLRSALLERLTDRQLEVVQVAYYGGFFESPRASTGEEIAETLDISPAAFYRHNRTVQRKLFAALFEDIGIPARPVGVE